MLRKSPTRPENTEHTGCYKQKTQEKTAQIVNITDETNTAVVSGSSAMKELLDSVNAAIESGRIMKLSAQKLKPVHRK